MLRREANFHGGFYRGRCGVGRQNVLYYLSAKNECENRINVSYQRFYEGMRDACSTLTLRKFWVNKCPRGCQFVQYGLASCFGQPDK